MRRCELAGAIDWRDTAMVKLIRNLLRQGDAAWAQRLAASAVLLVFLAAAYPGIPSLAQAYEGFGANTAGGANQPIYHVTNLNDSGAGSLRDALSQGNRYIVFDVGGVIETLSRIVVRGANITIDGFTAPSPGITIRNLGLRISGNFGAHDVIVRGLRVHIVSNVPGTEDGIAIVGGASNILIDHVSVRGASDENIGINNAHDITISWSILADPLGPRKTNMLITNGASRISIHHTLFFKANRRSPWITWLEEAPSSTLPPESPEIVADVRNNLLWEVSNEDSGHGAVVFGGAKANIVANFFNATNGISEKAQKRVIAVCRASGTTVEDVEFCETRPEFPPGRAFVANNISLDGWTAYINTKGTETVPFAAPFVTTSDACTAANQVLADAGMEPLDQLDQQYLSEIALPCPEITAPTPGSVLPGPDVTFTWTAHAANVSEWRLYIGSTQGAKDLHDSNSMGKTRTSREVKRLPTDGRIIWVQLRFQTSEGWQFADFQYTAARK
jgi:hypothetical protein